jgi:O-succinylhomoserine sulfhydrylase
MAQRTNVARDGYPGLVSHPQHGLAMQQQTLNGQGCGGASAVFDVVG